MESEQFVSMLKSISHDQDRQKKSIIERDLRQLVANHFVFAADETDFFDLTPVIRKYKGMEIKEVLDTIIAEIKCAGFYVGLSYGKTALFVYKDPHNPPENYYPD